MKSAGLDELKAGIKIGRKNINNLKYTDTTTLMAESKEELKNFLMRVKEESEKANLKLNIKQNKTRLWQPITSWHIEGEKWKQWLISSSWVPKITADGDCSHEIRWLLLVRKAMTNLENVLKSKDITLLTKVSMVKTMAFPVVTYGCESRTIKKAEYWRTDAFKLWCWRRLLRVPWTARRANQSILKEINTEYSLERLTLKLKL